jgi:hypothetical protein
MPSPAKSAARSGPPPAAYYRASGRKIRLHPHRGFVAVKESCLHDVLGAHQDVSAKVRQAGRSLGAGVILVPVDVLPPDLRDALAERGGTLPVFEAEGATLVVMPEVRVEQAPGTAEGGQAMSHVRRWLRDHASAVQLVRDQGTHLLLKPVSGRGADALALANEICESIAQVSAQPRFLRWMPRQ